MTSNDLLDMIGDARDPYILSAGERRNGVKAQHRPRPRRKILLITAVIAAMLLLVGCTVAIVMNLDRLILGTQNVDIPIDYHTRVTENRTMISLQGYEGTSNYQASREWRDFLQTYDPDGKILMTIDDKNTGIPVEYEAYSCYTQEMKDKIDEICKKYGLEILGKCYFEDTEEEFFGALGIDGIIADDTQADVTLWPEYYYKDGTFDVYGHTTLTGKPVTGLFPLNSHCAAS